MVIICLGYLNSFHKETLWKEPLCQPCKDPFKKFRLANGLNKLKLKTRAVK